jgi:hypothetical protein
MQVAAPLKRHPVWTTLGALIVLGLGAAGLYWFAPWNLFVDRRVDEALPALPVPEATTGEAAPGRSPAEPVLEAEPDTLAGGAFAGLEHDATGTALVVELEDGTRFLRLQDLETSNGPDLRVILSDRSLSDEWDVWDDGRYVDLGALKGNLGSSNYEIPADVDLDDFETAVIWCRRFSVGFGVAPLDPVR